MSKTGSITSGSERKKWLLAAGWLVVTGSGVFVGLESIGAVGKVREFYEVDVAACATPGNWRIKFRNAGKPSCTR